MNVGELYVKTMQRAGLTFSSEENQKIQAAVKRSMWAPYDKNAPPLTLDERARIAAWKAACDKARAEIVAKERRDALVSGLSGVLGFVLAVYVAVELLRAVGLLR